MRRPLFSRSQFCAAVLRLAALFYSIISFAELSLSASLLPLSLSRRVLEDRAGDRHRLCDHGLHRLLREAHLHPDQQHHRCARSSSSKSFTATLSTNCVCSLSRCRALQSAWAEVVLLSRCMEERMDRMRGGGSLAAGFYEETRGERRSPAAAFLVWMRCSTRKWHLPRVDAIANRTARRAPWSAPLPRARRSFASPVH